MPRLDPELRLVEVYQTITGLPALKATAQDDDKLVPPPFDFAISLSGWWIESPAQP